MDVMGEVHRNPSMPDASGGPQWQPLRPASESSSPGQSLALNATAGRTQVVLPVENLQSVACIMPQDENLMILMGMSLSYYVMVYYSTNTHDTHTQKKKSGSQCHKSYISDIQLPNTMLDYDLAVSSLHQKPSALSAKPGGNGS